MAENADGQEKKHDPGGKSLSEAMSKGNIARSPDITAALVLLAGTLGWTYWAPHVGDRILGLATLLSTPVLEPFDLSEAMALRELVWNTVLVVCSVPTLLIFVVSVIGQLAQTRGNLAWGAIDWDFSRVFNIWSGFRGLLFGPTPFIELGKALVKLTAVGYVVWGAVMERVERLPMLAALHPRALLEELCDTGWIIVMRAFPMMAVIAVIDYAITWYRRNKALMRTDQEVKDEARDYEPNPEIKGKRIQKYKQLIYGNLMSKLKQADVVVTNPTHYAVALRYRRNEDEAPIVLAKGVDYMARKIREEAFRLGIPRVEDRPLARALYAKGKLGKPIPNELYAPVAKILALVYRRRRRRAA